MVDQFSRCELIFGKEAIEKLKNSKIAIFGIGGVGGYVCEALARSGVSNFVLVDDDKVALSNINRQIIATFDSIDKYKVDCMKERILSINPNANVEIHKCFFMPSNQDDFDFKSYDYVIDAIDTVTAKIALVLKCNESKTPIISAMGAGNKINPTMLRVSDIYDTKVDPLSKVMRTELKKRRIKKLKVVYSIEKPIKPKIDNYTEEANKLETRDNTKCRSTPGSNAFVPSTMGLIIASEVIKDITNIRNDAPGV